MNTKTLKITSILMLMMLVLSTTAMVVSAEDDFDPWIYDDSSKGGNENNTIEEYEYLNSVEDYYDLLITYDQVSEVHELYNSQEMQWDPMNYDDPRVGTPAGNDNGLIDEYEYLNAVQDYKDFIITYEQVSEVHSLYNDSAQLTPSISYFYNSNYGTVTIASVGSGFYYADGASFNQANLAFSGEGISLFVLGDYIVGTQGIGDADLISSEIHAGDNLSGFPAGTYNMVWKPTAEVIGTVIFTDWSAEASSSSIPLGQRSSVVISISDNGCSPNEGVYVRIYGCGVDQSGVTDSNGEITFSVMPSSTGLISIDVGAEGRTVSETITVTGIQGGNEQIPIDMPQIEFVVDVNDKTIRVVSIDLPDILWSDIEISGDCSTNELGTLVYVGDQITNCYGRITISYNLKKIFQTVLFIWDFPLRIVESPSEDGYIYGTVYDGLTTPLPNATVYYRPLRNNSNNAEHIWIVTFTDNNGNYNLKLKPDVYELRAGQRRPSSEIVIIHLSKNQIVKQDFFIPLLIQTAGDFPIETINNTKLVESIKTGNIGGEITIWQNNSLLFEQLIMLYDGISIPSLDVEKGKISLIVSGDENSTGKTIAITTSLDLFDLTKDFVVEYDGEILIMADDVNDILNPNDDGLKAEYLITIGLDGVEILISIPHFSEHEIIISTLGVVKSLEELVEAVGGPEAALLYVSICIMASVVFVGAIYLRRKY